MKALAVVVLMSCALIAHARDVSAQQYMFQTASGMTVIDRAGVSAPSIAGHLDAAYMDMKACSGGGYLQGVVVVVLVPHLNGVYGVHFREGVYSIIFVEVQSSVAKTAHIAKHEFLHHHISNLNYGDGNPQHDSPLWVQCIGENFGSLEGVK